MITVWLAWNAGYDQGVVAATLTEVEDLAAQVEHDHGYVDMSHALRALGWLFTQVTVQPDC